MTADMFNGQPNGGGGGLRLAPPEPPLSPPVSGAPLAPEPLAPAPVAAPAVAVAEPPAAVAAPEPVQSEAPEASLETLIFKAGLISSDQLGELVKERVQTGRPVQEIVIERGWIDEQTLARLLTYRNGGPAAAPAPTFAPAPVPVAGAPVAPAVDVPVAPATEAPVAFSEPVVVPAPVAFQAAPVAPAPVLEVVPEPVLAFPPPSPPSESQAAMPAAEPLAVPAAEPLPAIPPTEPPLAASALEPSPTVPPMAPPEAALPGVAPAAGSVVFRVYARLTTGERIEVGAHADASGAREHAREVAQQLAGAQAWPSFAGRFVRPEAVVSLDVEAELG